MEMSDVAREVLEKSRQNGQRDVKRNVSNDITPAELQEVSPHHSETSTYTLASDQSRLSRDVDLWVRVPTASTGVQGTGFAPMLRSTSANAPSFHTNGIWYILALVLPFFSANNYPHWRCSPSSILNTAETMVSHLGRICDRVRYSIRRLAQNEMSREMFATAMDTVLFIYAIGFLILSMYQASIIG